MKKLIYLISLVLAGVLLSACNPAANEVAGIPAKQAVSIEAIVSTARGFTVGSETATKTVYVFFDAQCPHCGHLWEAAKPLQSNTRFGWIPVAFLNKASAAQGATLLGSDNPAARMDEHEASLMAHQGGITAGAVAPDLKVAIERNTKLLTSFGAESIPFIVAVDASGKVVSKAGALSTEALATMLGIAPPGTPVVAKTPIAVPVQ